MAHVVVVVTLLISFEEFVEPPLNLLSFAQP